LAFVVFAFYILNHRRIKAERQSRIKAMEERAKKGLLSEEEEVILAAEKAQGDEGGCSIA